MTRELEINLHPLDSSETLLMFGSGFRVFRESAAELELRQELANFEFDLRHSTHGVVKVGDGRYAKGKCEMLEGETKEREVK